MLKANVGLSRKITRDYNSTGYSVNIEGEITAPLDDPEAVVARIHELFHLAEEALAVEIDRDQGEDAIGRRDQEPKAPPTSNGHNSDSSRSEPPRRNQEPEKQPRQGRDDDATNKQIQYLLSIGKRQRLSTNQLETKIEQLLGRRVGVYQLSKREAGTIIDHLTNNGAESGKTESRR